MNVRRIIFFLIFTILLYSQNVSAEFRFPLGVTYTQGFGNIIDAHKKNRTADGYTSGKSNAWPAGFSASSYYLFSNGFSAGCSAGPLFLIRGNSRLVLIPASVDCRYFYTLSERIKPFARAGFGFCYAAGTYVNGSVPGFTGGIGAEFLKFAPVDFGFDAGYSYYFIKYDKKPGNGSQKINPVSFSFSVYAVL